MKALTLQPIAATLVAGGDKTIECRTWQTKYRGPILFCAGAKKMRGYLHGHAFMVAELVDIVPFEKKHLKDAAMAEMPDEKCYAWLFKNFKVIYPFKQKGQLGLFNVDDELIKIIPDDAPDEVLFELYSPLLR